ncbi:hypothetical protein [Brachybacterium sp. YJGR34]|uniref:hypothetical protein n=1 Tax=Brachybacterium sp. YJGR34 TaxID=2059911 RepID=UPI001E3CF3D7|nr:hypothetical protein [Brachybacterium sp. YJGR34]
MQRLLAVLLVLIGLAGLVLGRLGETTWAPATETTATVALENPGPAVVLDPGVLYVGGEQGEVVIEGASDVSVITASNDDIAAYLEGVRHTRITGASDWTTLSTETVDPEGETELTDPTSSDLWRTVDTGPSPYTLDVQEFWAGENGENEQVYRAILIVTDGAAPGADQVSITWPVEAENEWVPYAYAGGAAVAVVGLVLLVVSLGRRRGEGEEDPVDVDQQVEDESHRAEGTDVPEETVWALGEDGAAVEAGSRVEPEDGSEAAADPVSEADDEDEEKPAATDEPVEEPEAETEPGAEHDDEGGERR